MDHLFSFVRSVVLRVACVGGLLLAVAPAVAADTDIQPYRVEEVFPQLRTILEQAMSQSPQVLQRSLDITQAEAAHVMTRSALLPRVDGSVYYSTNNTSVSEQTSVSSKSDGIFYNLSMSQPLFQWGTLKAQVNSSKIGVEIAQKNYAEAYRLLAITLRQQYTIMIVRKASRGVAAESLRVVQSSLDVEEEKLRAGRISPGDIIGSRLALEEAKLGLERADADFQMAKRAFCRFAGLATIEDDAVPDSIPVNQLYYGSDRAEPILRMFSAAGVDDLLPLQVLQAQVRQADLNYKVAKYRLFPKFSISANVSQSNSTNASVNSVTQVGVNSQNINVMAVWSIFDGFATSGAKKSALATKRTNERQWEIQRQVALDQAKDLERQLAYGARAVQLYDTRLALAEDGLKRAKDNLERGLGTQKEVDAAQLAHLGTSLGALQQRADFLNRWAEFLSLTGHDSVLKLLPARYLQHGK
jgi:outer membrane protein TolC